MVIGDSLAPKTLGACRYKGMFSYRHCGFLVSGEVKIETVG